MKIPNRFKLLGQTIEVVFGEEFFLGTDCIGYAAYRSNQIQLKPVSAASPRSESQMEQTFLHELMHWILFFSEDTNTGKERNLHQEENFVDMTAHLLQQALNSFEYDNDEKDKS